MQSAGDLHKRTFLKVFFPGQMRYTAGLEIIQEHKVNEVNRKVSKVLGFGVISCDLHIQSPKI